MLYPIELLRQTFAPHADGVTQRTACMLTGMPLFVMSSVGFLRVGGCATGWWVVGYRSLAARVSDYGVVGVAGFLWGSKDREASSLLQFDWGWWRGLAQNKAFRTTLRFPSGETSEKIPFACACSVRGIVSAHRCLSAVGFSSPTYYSAHGATSARRFFSACVLWWPCVGRPRGAPGSECTGLLTCVRLPPFV